MRVCFTCDRGKGIEMGYMPGRMGRHTSLLSCGMGTPNDHDIQVLVLVCLCRVTAGPWRPFLESYELAAMMMSPCGCFKAE